MKRIATNAQSDTEPDELSRTAYHEAGHAVAHVGVLGEHCHDVRVLAEPRSVMDRKGTTSDEALRPCWSAVHDVVDAFLPSREILWEPVLRGVKNGKINRSVLIGNAVRC